MSWASRSSSGAMAAALVFAFLVVSLSVSAEEAPRILAYVVSADDLSAHVAPARKAVRDAYGAKRVLFLRDELDCTPETEPGCTSTLETKNRAAATIVVRIYWARAGCRPIYDSRGKRTGHRALRSREARIIALSKGTVREIVTVRPKTAPLDEAIARALQELAAKMASGSTGTPDGGTSP